MQLVLLIGWPPMGYAASMVDGSVLHFRVMHPAGSYPSEAVACEHGLLAEAVHRGYVFSVVRPAPADDHESEVCWALPSEVRFWASITLAYRENAWSACAYPLRQVPLHFANVEFDSDLIWRIALHFDDSFIQEYVGELGAYHRIDRIDTEFQTRLVNAIDIGDSLMIRGLSALLKANILARTGCLFGEEAILQMFFAMETSLSIARRRLEKRGIAEPSVEEAIEHVSSGIAPKKQALRFFRECYDKRVSLVHHDSGVTREAVPLLWADDLYDNYEVVAGVYRRLLLGSR